MGAILERPQAPATHRLDVGAHYRMAEAGIFSHPQRVELIDGDIFDMNPIGCPQAALKRRLAQLRRALLESHRRPLCLVRADDPRLPDAGTIPEATIDVAALLI